MSLKARIKINEQLKVKLQVLVDTLENPIIFKELKINIE